jgi:hypothetical protein
MPQYVTTLAASTDTDTQTFSSPCFEQNVVTMTRKGNQTEQQFRKSIIYTHNGTVRVEKYKIIVGSV